MLGRLLSAIDTVRLVREDAWVWLEHLTGEGLTTVGRQRDAIAQALAAGLQAPSRHRAFVYERLAQPEARGLPATRPRQPVLSTR